MLSALSDRSLHVAVDSCVPRGCSIINLDPISYGRYRARWLLYLRQPVRLLGGASAGKVDASHHHLRLYHHSLPPDRLRLSRGNCQFRQNGARYVRSRRWRHLFRRTDTDHKALRKGAYLECKVCLGRTKRIPSYGNSSITCASLKFDGYDSILIPRPNGQEHVIYDANQVMSIKRVYTWW